MQVRSSHRLEGECQRNVEVMWLLGRLQPDYKSIAEFRRMHSQAATDAGAELVQFARSVGLVRGRDSGGGWFEVPGLPTYGLPMELRLFMVKTGLQPVFIGMLLSQSTSISLRLCCICGK